jgi:hypothetical protein
MSEEMHRDFCPRCAVKHLGKASVLMKEYRLGYPHHVWYAMSNMSEAEDEIVDMMPKEAEAIRVERIQMQDALSNGTMYYPDFTGLMYLVAEGGLLEEAQGLERVDLGGNRHAPFEEGGVGYIGQQPMFDKWEDPR